MTISPRSYLPISKAAKLYNIPVDHLSYLVENGKIDVIEVNKIPCLSESDIMANLPKRDQPDYQKYMHLRGHGIGMGEGGRKYGISQPTISRWVKRGWIDIVGREGRQKILIDEADLAYCAEAYHSDPSNKQGHWLFTREGIARKKK